MTITDDPEPARPGTTPPVAADGHGTDADLLAAVRGGDTGAYAALWIRHAHAARRLAYTLVSNDADADDLVSETFVKVLAMLRAGRGPAVVFRPYLHTTLRHVRHDRLRRDRRLDFTDDLSRFEAAGQFEDTTLARLERSYAIRAFTRLPHRWRLVLWHTEVQGETPAQVAPRFGLTPGGVAALAYRARERLREMYLREHIISTTVDPDCQRTRQLLAAYVRERLAVRARDTVDTHLGGCRACHRLRTELDEVNADLRMAPTPGCGTTGRRPRIRPAAGETAVGHPPITPRRRAVAAAGTTVNSRRSGPSE
ncbi:sigma-70 family RNA polymerase sigma factor [Polymorphospora rubra]|uniref:sigma-70 family RNA polymerase sigma factor n=1 Tax=Polymorphospora rubra TaxID=338584 RepID=UPI00340905BA